MDTEQLCRHKVGDLVSCQRLLMLDVCIVLQFEKMGYAYGYNSLDKIRDWIYDALDRVSQVGDECVCSLCSAAVALQKICQLI